MDISSSVPVYPSQLCSFKLRSDLLAETISDITHHKILSTFKRYDYLALALGYKGHSDLIQATKFRSQADKNVLLELFSYPVIVAAIIDVFCARLDYLNQTDAEKACALVADEECIFSAYQKSPYMGMYMTEIIMKIREAEFFKPWADRMKKLKEELAPRRERPLIVINISDAPAIVIKTFTEHPQVQRFLKAVHSFNKNHPISYLYQQENMNSLSGKPVNEYWKIRVSIDAWGTDAKEAVKNWQALKDFCDWFRSFHASDRIQLTERIDSHEMSYIYTQYHSSISMRDFREKLSSAKDRDLFDLLRVDTGEIIFDDKEGNEAQPAEVKNKTGQYAPLFENSNPIIDFSKVNYPGYININEIDTLTKTTVGKTILSNLVAPMLTEQVAAIETEKERLQQIIDENPATVLSDHCQHNIKDEFGSKNGTEFHCLVCDYWS